MQSNWTLIGDASDSPQHYIKFSTTSSSYEAYVTDLTTVWKERLERRSIIKRAFHEDLSIDPSEDAQQMTTFLAKLASAALREDGTKLERLSTSEEKCFKVLLTAPLPSPLQPIRWPLDLERMPGSILKSELILPMLAFASTQTQIIRELILALQEKDLTITKFLDYIDRNGSDLADVFPGAAASRLGRKSAPREAVAKLVKGLQPLDMDTWTENFRNLVQSNLAGVDAASILPKIPLAKSSQAFSVGLLLSEEGTRVKSQPKVSAGSEETHTEPAKTTECSSPSNIHQTARAKSSVPAYHESFGGRDIDSTDSIAEDEAPFKEKPQRRGQSPEIPYPESKFQHPTRMGAIGGKRQRKSGHVDGDVTGAQRTEQENPTHAELSLLPAVQEQSGKPKLGKIGGKAHVKASNGSVSGPPAEPASTHISQERSKSPEKHIGNQLSNEPDQQASLNPDGQSAPTADQKREALRRDMASKASIAPRKKRRF